MAPVTEEIQLRLSPSRIAPAAARGALGPLRGAVDRETLESTTLLVTELVTNAVLHAGLRDDRDWIDLSVEVSEDLVRAGVTDHGGGFARPPPDPQVEDPSGWGLFLVSRLADRWGIERGQGTLVWFEIDRTATHTEDRSR
jgi:anti-sigma regulatory factor (Ser/Thr protein kinase)